MKKIVPVLILSTIILTSCSIGSHKSGDKCDPNVRRMTENSHGDQMYCHESGIWVQS